MHMYLVSFYNLFCHCFWRFFSAHFLYLSLLISPFYLKFFGLAHVVGRGMCWTSWRVGSCPGTEANGLRRPVLPEGKGVVLGVNKLGCQYWL